MFTRIQNYFIKLIVGKKTVIMNAYVKGSIIMDSYEKGLIVNNVIGNNITN